MPASSFKSWPVVSSCESKSPLDWLMRVLFIIGKTKGDTSVVSVLRLKNKLFSSDSESSVASCLANNALAEMRVAFKSLGCWV